MDRILYTAMSGAKQTLARQDTLANNIANASTHGFRADTVAFRAVPLQTDAAGTRVFVVETSTGSNLAPGSMMRTDNELDIAVQGEGWIAVQAPDGSEAFTRNGALVVTADGTLATAAGAPVMGGGGPISIPPDSQISIGSDGTVSVKTPGQSVINSVGRIKLVNPPAAEMVKGLDGLFRSRGGEAAADETVRIAGGMLESSNVNVVENMVSMIGAARQFEMQMKMLSTAEQNEQKSNQLLGA
ncbi:MAG: flagellar basal-body rod protein FlgF [Burkholderiaceae bacterium]